MSIITKFFPASILIKVAYGHKVEEGDYHLERLECSLSYQNRWGDYFEYVFKDVATGKYYTFIHGRDITEEHLEEGFPMKNPNGDVKCFEVKPMEISVTRYEFVEE